ncbi:hypothetical protein Slala05_15030 [Streptomyces lavendulae subsp. lavendulae]|nr:hypothetical protein Slala05_15030 [Streptomyces lavendulae subsp. lavendulae]
MYGDLGGVRPVRAKPSALRVKARRVPEGTPEGLGQDPVTAVARDVGPGPGVGAIAAGEGAPGRGPAVFGPAARAHHPVPPRERDRSAGVAPARRRQPIQ